MDYGRPKIKETGFPAFSVNASRNISLNTSGGFPAPLNPNKYAPSVEVNEPGFSGDTSSRYSSRGSSYVNSSHDTSIRNSTPTPPPRKSKNVQSFNGDGASPNTGFSPLNNREGSSSRNYVLPPEIIFRTPPPPVNAAVAKGSVTPVKFAAPVKRNESAPEPAPSATTFSAPKIDPKKVAFKSGFKDILQLYLNKSSNIDEVVHSLIEYISNYSNPTFCLEQIFAYCCEDIKYDCGKERNDASKLLLKCLQQNSALKNAFSVAFKNYCKYIVKYNIEQNQVNLILTFPNFFAHLLANNSSKIIPINAFIDGFKQFHAAGSLMFARTFAEFGRVYKPQDQFNVGARMGMLYHEFCALDPYYKSKEIQIILEKNLFKYDRYNNLKTLLDSMNCFKNFVDY
uniref:Uncharacterized protein n=1 Tax=Panagrolaimus superbus TaxID=310955 RepID=A0A914YS35_9BILA